MGKPILVPNGDVTSLGSAIFAFLAAGTFRTVEEAQQALCPKYRVIEPEPRAASVYRSFTRRGVAPISDWGAKLPNRQLWAACCPCAADRQRGAQRDDAPTDVA